jgi:hypothetical protein
MPDGWVVFAYLVVYGFMVLYTLSLFYRVRRVKRRMED